MRKIICHSDTRDLRPSWDLSLINIEVSALVDLLFFYNFFNSSVIAKIWLIQLTMKLFLKVQSFLESYFEI